MQALLDDAGMPYTSAIRQGHVTHEMTRDVEDPNYTGIVSERGMRPAYEIFRSTAYRVIALTTIRVTPVN